MALYANPAGWTPPRVCPRVLVDGGAVRVDDAVREALSDGARMIVLLGRAGTGATTALGCVAAALGSDTVSFFDDPPNAATVQNESLFRPVVFASSARLAGECVRVLRLAAWGRDEVVEWALGEAPEKRKGFVERAMKCLDEGGESSPEVLAAVWEVMCADDTVDSMGAAVVAAIGRRCGDGVSEMRRAGEGALLMMLGHDAAKVPESAKRLIRHQSVRLVLAAEHLVALLREGKTGMLLIWMQPNLLDAAAKRMVLDVRARAVVGEVLQKAVTKSDVAMAASLMHLSGGKWTPSGVEELSLSWAVLPGVEWIGARARRARLDGAYLSGANLSGSTFRGASGTGVRLVGANLWEAEWDAVELVRADMSRACLRAAGLRAAVLTGVNLTHVDASDAKLSNARVVQCCLKGARLDRADLTGAVVSSCEFGRASLSGTVLREGALSGADLRTVAIDDLCLEDARVREALLGGVVATGVVARRCRFTDCDFTGSVLRCACFEEATFSGCGLAEVWWEGADLRRADFTGSTFHMGSSRCGLVGSPIAGEGSKTGFYTDDYSAQHYKPPEEISKADLRGADLRGAKVEGVDFYLVDLRGAIYEQEQAEWFRKCGAILHARA